MPSMLQQYEKITRLPAGNFLFKKAIAFTAPFFGKIKPNIVEYRAGYCEVQIKNRWSVRNHIGTINAGALCTLAELTGGMTLDSIVPKTKRWIPRSMTVNYIKKATGVITATCNCQISAIEDIGDEGDLIVSIEVNNVNSETVFTADITFYISLKKSNPTS